MKNIAVLFSFIILSICLSAQDANGTIINEGDKMPEFTLNSVKYGNVNSKNLKGKVVLINIFATWCGPCQKELAEVQKTLYPKYKDNLDFVMLVIGREHTDEELETYNAKKKFSFALYPDPKRDFTNKFATKNIPRSYLIDKEGNVVYASIGFGEQEFKHLLDKIEETLKQ